MAITRTARRYARAVFDIALDEGSLDTWQRDLQAMAIRLAAPEVLAFAGDPAVTVAAKQALVDEGLAGMERRRLSLAHLLIERGRLAELPAIVEEFDRLVREHQGIAEAEVTTAVPLAEEDAQEVQRRLASITGKTVVLRRKVDPAIVGGLVVRIGDRLIDASLATRLEVLRSQLAG